jgi:hypothetical protein
MPDANETDDRSKDVERDFAETEQLDFSGGQILGFVISGCVILAALVVPLVVIAGGDPSLRLPVSISSASLLILAIIFPAAIYLTSVDDRNARRRLWQQHKIAEAIGSVNDPETPSLRNLLLLNRQEMTNYHELTKQQARRSFSNSLVAMWLGFLIVGACILIIALPGVTDENSKLTVSLLGSVGTIVSGFITRTFLKQRTLSIDQLNRFFNQPLVTSYLLTAERIALEQPSADVKTESLNRVIAAALAAANDGRSKEVEPT